MTSGQSNTLQDEETPPSLSPEEARVLGQVRAGLFGVDASVKIDRFVLVRRTRCTAPQRDDRRHQRRARDRWWHRVVARAGPGRVSRTRGERAGGLGRRARAVDRDDRCHESQRGERRARDRGAGSTAEAKDALQRAVAIAEANAVGRERLDELRAAISETTNPPR